MAKRRKLFSPITILMVVITIAAAGTWIVPVGRDNTLSYVGNSFKYDTDSVSVSLPFNKKTLDSSPFLFHRKNLQKVLSGSR